MRGVKNMADDKSDDRPVVISIPKNYRVPGKWKHFYIRNISEAVAVDFFLFQIIVNSPFVFQIKIVGGVLILALATIFLVSGINEKSTFQFLYGYIKYVYTRKDYHFEKLEDVYGKAHSNREENEEPEEESTRSSKLDQIKARFQEKRGKEK